MKSARTKAVDISSKVRKEIHERDKWCIICGSNYNLSIAHFIPRSKGGLGVKENLVLLCFKCHMDYDQSLKRGHLGSIISDYLKKQYGDIDKNDLIYKKGIK